MDEQDVVKALGAMAQVSRLRVFRTLIVAGPSGLTPGALGAELDLAATTLSFHLKELMNAGLVSQQRDGRNLIYRAVSAQMLAVLGYLTAHCCQAQICSLSQPATGAPVSTRRTRVSALTGLRT
jgi:ArsR family transcriptional regulator, arsenate/arsenite/antimonite-responsive transcriptional repressor